MSSLSARALASLLGEWRTASTASAYSTLADRVRLLVLDGRIPCGMRLPAEREIAAQLEISRTTVTAAYAELRDAGYLSSVRGSGSVAKLPARAAAMIDTDQAGYLDFSKAAMAALPGLAGAAEQAVAELPAYLGGIGFSPLGLPELRDAIARRYTERGLPTDTEQIMVTTGAQHAIALLASTLLGRGDSALVESPSYPNAYDAIRLTGARLVPVSVTSDAGWDGPGLEQAIQRSSPAVGYLMPDFHNPTGRTMPKQLRERTVALAAAHGTVLIADETTAELSIDRLEQYAPFGAGAPHVVLIGSVGKTVWGGVRVGWIRADRGIIHSVVRARSAGDLGTPVLEQLLVKNLLNDFDSLLEIRREQLRTGRDHLVAALRAAFPEWSVPNVHGGLTVWVGLGDPVSSQLALAARNEGLLLAAGPRFGIDGAFERFLRLPFSYSIAETDRAVAALAAAWQSLSRIPFPEQNYLAEVI
jgi:DNA-binding transcriptional MocR family regulator